MFYDNLVSFFFSETTEVPISSTTVIIVDPEKSSKHGHSAKSGPIRPNTHSQRLRALLAPLPRHIMGPVPTFSSREENGEPEEPPAKAKFSCPQSIGRSSRGRSWRAHPDPRSCRWKELYRDYEIVVEEFYFSDITTSVLRLHLHLLQ